MATRICFVLFVVRINVNLLRHLLLFFLTILSKKLFCRCNFIYVRINGLYIGNVCQIRKKGDVLQEMFFDRLKYIFIFVIWCNFCVCVSMFVIGIKRFLWHKNFAKLWDYLEATVFSWPQKQIYFIGKFM